MKDRGDVVFVTGARTVTLLHAESQFQSSFEKGLNATTDFSCVGSYGTVEEALNFLSKHPSQFILVDQQVPGADCLQQAMQLGETTPSAKLLLLARSEEPSTWTTYLQAGALAILLQPCGVDECLGALRSVLNGGIHLSRSAMSALARTLGGQTVPDPIASLTGAERKVVGLLREGQSDKEIASSLGIAVGTVHRHNSNIFRKLEVRSRAEVVRKCFTPSPQAAAVDRRLPSSWHVQ